MFRIGDYVAHYKEGVCEVVNIGKIDMGSSDKEYYTLKPVYDAAGTIYTPVDNKREQIRQLITKEEAENLIKEMSEIDTIGVTNEKQREAMYKNALLHNQCREWVSLIKTSYGRNKERIQAGKRRLISMRDICPVLKSSCMGNWRWRWRCREIKSVVM